MKKYLIVFIGLVIAAGMAAFTTKTHTTAKKMSPSTGYFHFGGADMDQNVESEYTYIGQEPPENDCEESSVICTILAPLNDNGHPENSSYWKPDFSVLGDPTVYGDSYDYLSKRSSSK